MKRSVNHLLIGESGIIKESSIIPLQLLEIGVIPFANVKLLNVSPFNDCLYLNVDGSYLVLRRESVDNIFI